MVDRIQLYKAYDAVKRAVRSDCSSAQSAQKIIELAKISLQFLSDDCEQISLRSEVRGKEYISFALGNVLSRPANLGYFIPSADDIVGYWDQGEFVGNLDSDRLAQTLYTVALAPCLAFDLFNRNDKKRPATYFECLVGHIFAKSLGINPTKNATLPLSGRSVQMTMDFLFEIGGNAPSIHLPVKTSTRERVVQAWPHQRLLDSAYGPDSYKGILVAFSETKLDIAKREVVEICVPDQWLAYQTLLAKMERIYYFDIPVRYQELTDEFPSVIAIRPFHAFFTESASVAS